jgi:hypothetical protein
LHSVAFVPLRFFLIFPAKPKSFPPNQSIPNKRSLYQPLTCNARLLARVQVMVCIAIQGISLTDLLAPCRNLAALFSVPQTDGARRNDLLELVRLD